MGDIRDFRNFMGAVIDERAFDRITGHIVEARTTAQVIAGGECDKSTGYFIRPTLIETDRSWAPPAVRGDLRTGRHRVRLRRQQVDGDAGRW